MTKRKITAVGLTDVGRRRDHNEDDFSVALDQGAYVVCDGMGGHASGEVASQMTVEHILEFLARHPAGEEGELPYGMPKGATLDEAILSNAVQHANERVYIAGMKDSKLEGMGTTVVAMRETADGFAVAHVGDSRVYRWSAEEGLTPVTRDHSLLNHKIDRGELRTPGEIAGFKQGNIIVRAIGLKDYVTPEVQSVPRRAGDVFLLCSDGLTDLVDDWSITNVIEGNSAHLEEGGTCLIRMANNAGGKDNITVLLMRVDDETAPAEAPMMYRDEDTHPGMDAFHEEVTQPNGIAAMDEVVPAASATPEIGPDLDDGPTRPDFRLPPGLEDDAIPSIIIEEARPIAFTSSDAMAKARAASLPPMPESDLLPSIIVDDSLID